MKSTIKDWLKVAVLLLDEVAIIVVVFLVLRALEVEIPLPVAIAGALVLGVLVFDIHKAVIPTFHKKKITGREEMVGLEGKVTKPLTPTGVVQVRNEYWKAKSVSGSIAVDEEVEILKVEGLTLTVRLKE